MIYYLWHSSVLHMRGVPAPHSPSWCLPGLSPRVQYLQVRMGSEQSRACGKHTWTGQQHRQWNKAKKLCKYKIPKVICYTLDFVHKALAHRNTTCVGHVLFCFWWGTEREKQRSRRSRSQQRCSEELCILWVHMSVCLSVWVPTDSVCYCRGCNLMQTVSYIKKL